MTRRVARWAERERDRGGPEIGRRRASRGALGRPGAPGSPAGPEGGVVSAAQGVGGDGLDDTAPESGAVYVFRRTGTAWQQEAYVKASNTGANDEFGQSVALSGDTLAIGAPLEASAAQGVGGNQDDNSATESGAVYNFH